MLTYASGSRAFVLLASDPGVAASAERAGLDQSRPLTKTKGFPVFITREPAAALQFFKLGDVAAQTALAGVAQEAKASWASGAPGFTAPCPRGRAFLPFQLAGIQYALNRQHTLIGDEPGLGKTIQAIGLSNAAGSKFSLVICPASLRLNWRREIRAWSTIPDVGVYPVMKAKDGVNPFSNYVLISYELARQPDIHATLCELGAKRGWDHLILDEAHYLKTPGARRTHAIFGYAHNPEIDHISKYAKRITALTGTPLPNRPRECYTITRALCWDAIDWMSYDAFTHRYNPSFAWPSGRVEERMGHLPELQFRLRTNFMVRRLKKDVLKDLPPKQYELTYVEETGAIRHALRAEALLHFDPSKLDQKMLIDGAVSTARRLMGEAVAPRAVEHVKILFDGGVEKILLGAWHHSVMDYLEKNLQQFGVLRLDGKTPKGRIEAMKAIFQSDPKVGIWLGQLQASGEGHNLTAASHVVLAEPSWVPKDNEQFIDRAHRIGQKGNVLAQFLVAPGSLAERILGVAIEKAQVIHATLDR